MVTNIFPKKYFSDHLQGKSLFSFFFQFSEASLQKRTFINVLFQKKSVRPGGEIFSRFSSIDFLIYIYIYLRNIMYYYILFFINKPSDDIVFTMFINSITIFFNLLTSSGIFCATTICSFGS